MRLLDLFRANGCLYDDQGFIKLRYWIVISYGYSSYRGYFESFDVTEDAKTPYRFIYNAVFKAEETVYNYVDPGKTYFNP
jgi:hypothetical protein